MAAQGLTEATAPPHCLRSRQGWPARTAWSQYARPFSPRAEEVPAGGRTLKRQAPMNFGFSQFVASKALDSPRRRAWRVDSDGGLRSRLLLLWIDTLRGCLAIAGLLPTVGMRLAAYGTAVAELPRR
jgi:hypothetical protein